MNGKHFACGIFIIGIQTKLTFSRDVSCQTVQTKTHEMETQCELLSPDDVELAADMSKGDMSDPDFLLPR